MEHDEGIGAHFLVGCNPAGRNRVELSRFPDGGAWVTDLASPSAFARQNDDLS